MIVNADDDALDAVLTEMAEETSRIEAEIAELFEAWAAELERVDSEASGVL
jgi:hypothetical protein